jgi:homoserine O-acetyltransferase
MSARDDPRKRRVRLVLGIGALSACAIAVATAYMPPRQQFARLGDFRLQNGAVITDLVVGYRTAGHLDASRSNAVLVMPWFQGTSWQLAWQIGPGKLVDTERNFVILVDALGNGVSSSPSNSARQAGASFPLFSMADVVETQRLLVTRTLQLARLRAVVGISMGGMQAFEWAAAQPAMVDNVVSIVGSPNTQPDDVKAWEETIQWMRTPARTRARLALVALSPISAVNELRAEPYDAIRQAEAIIGHNIFTRYDGSLDRTAAAIRTRLLIVTTWADRAVNPRPAFELARAAGASVLELDGRCGHKAPSCERATLWPAVNRFLDESVP